MRIQNPMKLVIQIPCYNEAKTLALTLSMLPKKVPGFDTVEWLIINDGSTDDTIAVAKANGVDHIVSFPRNQGLACVEGSSHGVIDCSALHPLSYPKIQAF
jgi:glycosyltransferase involved in cell wall biosynthesis